MKIEKKNNHNVCNSKDGWCGYFTVPSYFHHRFPFRQATHHKLFHKHSTSTQSQHEIQFHNQLNEKKKEKKREEKTIDSFTKIKLKLTNKQKKNKGPLKEDECLMNKKCGGRYLSLCCGTMKQRKKISVIQWFRCMMGA